MNKLLSRIATVNKAIAAAVTGFGAAYATAAVDGVVTGPEWLSIVIATAIAVGAVWGVPNGPGPIPPIDTTIGWDEPGRHEAGDQ